MSVSFCVEQQQVLMVNVVPWLPVYADMWLKLIGLVHRLGATRPLFYICQMNQPNLRDGSVRTTTL